MEMEKKNEEENNKVEEEARFLTLAAPSMPVPLAPKSFQVWRETTASHPPPSDSNLTVLESSATATDSSADQPPKKLGFINYEVEPGLTIRLRHNIDHDMDPRKLKRVISNRVSAQKSRIKKLQYVADLEKRYKELEMQVAVLRPHVAIAREHKRFVEMEQRELNLRIAACHEHFQRTEGAIEGKKGEITRLMRKLAIQQEEEEEEGGVSNNNGFIWGNEASSTAMMMPYSLLHPNIHMPPPTL